MEKMIGMTENDNGLIVKISGKSLLESTPLDAVFNGKYAAYKAYLFYLENLASDGVKVFFNGNPIVLEEFQIVAEVQSALHEVQVSESFQGMILA
jgi:hypothetical protein